MNNENLKPFKPGQTGNPNGRPKKLPKLDELLAEVLSEEKDGKTAAQAILMALRAKATKGDVRAAELLMDRAWGKSVQLINANVNTNNSPSWFNPEAIMTTNGHEKES